MRERQKDKDNHLIYLYANNLDEQHSYIATARERSYDVLLMDGVLDNHFLNTLESKLTDSHFRRVDSDTIDKLIPKAEENISRLDDKQKESLKTILEKNIDKEKFSVVYENLSETEMPLIVIQPEFMRRMKDISAMGGGYAGLGSLPEHFNLVANTNNPLMLKILEEQDEQKQNYLVSQLYDLALLSQNLLKGEKLTDFIKRSIEIVK